ncbi:hypothetical protein ZIOFF_042009 [Zingiber officinale]|uniref:RING-type E3 ubiquitin transferase n=1 Tax=Zingiber officinale TaxID=94328 RepID=A0A8J5L6F0_ZINOF|nr:hypothetical protein ZIOFF_042009 [Zingiber officinale]
MSVLTVLGISVDTMEPPLSEALLYSVTEFGFVSSSSNVQLELLQRYCQKINHILENFKPVCDEIVASGISLDVKLVKVLDELEAAINKARELILSWHPLMSKIYFVLQIETIVTKIYSSTHEICQLVTSVLLSPEDSMAVKCMELQSHPFTVQEIQFLDEKQISVAIEKAIRDQSDNGFPSSEYLNIISSSLSLLSNEELLLEVVTLEKLKVKLGCNHNTLLEIEDIDSIIALFTYMHDCYTKIHQVRTVNGVSVPADFCCPLSLNLMSDPVIVESGQTYERAFIQKWLDQGIDVCPRTRQTLRHSNLIPNFTVKALIANWCESNEIRLPDPLNSTSSNFPSFLELTDVSDNDLVSHAGHATNTNLPRALESYGKASSQKDSHPSNGLTSQETYASEKSVLSPHVSSNLATLQSTNGLETNHSGLPLATIDSNQESGVELRNARSGSQIVDQSNLDLIHDNLEQPGDANVISQFSSDLTYYISDASGELAQDSQASSAPRQEPKFPLGFVEARSRSQNMWRRPSADSASRVHSQSLDSRSDLSDAESEIRKLIEDLKIGSMDVQRNATGELRLLAKHNIENRIVIANCGAISLLVGLLYSTDPKTQENAVTALLNLSLNDNNKIAIGNANSIGPLIHVLETGNAEAKENTAATFYSLSVIEENKVRIGRSGAIAPLVELLANGTPRGKKDATTALFNLSIFHENKARIVQAGAVKYLVELMDPAAGMVDKAVAVLSNLATVAEGRTAIAQAGGITALVEVVELGSTRGKENAAATLLQLCMNSSRYCRLVLQEGAVPPLVALSQAGSSRAKEKAEEAASDREQAVARDSDGGGAPVDERRKEHAAVIPNAAAAIGIHHLPRELKNPHWPENRGAPLLF